jgi:hypothetical protein
MSEKPAPDSGRDRDAPPDDEDVEGHSMLDPWSGMKIVESRERDIKQAYRRKALEEEARRPHRKEGR